MSWPIYPVFPTLRGLAWPVVWKPVANSLVQDHVSGRQAVWSLEAFPRIGFEISYAYLKAGPRLTDTEMQTLIGFFLDRRGRSGAFLFPVPKYSAPGLKRACGWALGAGNGSRTSFAFTVPLGTIGIPVGQVDTTGLVVYLDGAAADPSTWSVTLPGTLVFTTAPATGVQVTADYDYSFLCRFDQDQAELENFMYELWRAQSVKFTSFKP